MSKNLQPKLVTIIGAGPVGIESALYAKNCGYDVRVLEKKEAGHNIRQWGHVTFFSPFGMNYSPLGKKLLSEQGISLLPDDAYLPARDFLKGYLLPLAASPFLQPHIISDCKVLAISRQFTLKGDFIGNEERKNHPFRILTRDGQGKEKIYYSDYIIDASGTYGNHNWMGNGGIPAPGEAANEQRIQYGLEDIAGAAKLKYAGKITLVVGDGHSAGNTMVALKQVLEENRETKVIWLTRGERKLPLLSVPDDSLAERERIVRQANALIFHRNIRWIKNAAVEALEYDEKNGQFRVEIEIPGGAEKLIVDNIVANVGHTPDNSIYRELQVHECYASRGPMKLAAALLNVSSADCLTHGGHGAEALKNPEPDFYILGMKSYGKSANFLLKTGFEQIRDVFQLITGDMALDLYAEISVPADVAAQF